LRKKAAKFKWGREQQESLEALKKVIAQPPVLRMSNFSKKFILQTDASSIPLGKVLSQETDEIRQPVAYASRRISAQERKSSSIYELECSAVLFGTDKFGGI
jgi:hypothetical protein